MTNNIVWFLNYAATHPDTKIRYPGSNMVLHIDSDTSLLVKKSRSRVGGHFYISPKSGPDHTPPTAPPPQNGPSHTTRSILRNKMVSTSEEGLRRLFHNA